MTLPPVIMVPISLKLFNWVNKINWIIIFPHFPEENEETPSGFAGNVELISEKCIPIFMND
jgi:hypothetical protein